MLILALDSSSSLVSVAMVDYSSASTRSDVLYHDHEVQSRTDSSSFFGGLEKAIIKIGKPKLIVVGIGPGSYNGLRVSLAAAQGMASALDVEIRGIPSVLAMDTDKPHYWAVGDARGGTYWVALVMNHQWMQEPVLLTPEHVSQLLLTQPDIPLMSSTPLQKLSKAQHVTITYPSAILLAQLSQEASYKNNSLTPLYLKPAHITLPSS